MHLRRARFVKKSNKTPVLTGPTCFFDPFFLLNNILPCPLFVPPGGVQRTAKTETYYSRRGPRRRVQTRTAYENNIGSKVTRLVTAEKRRTITVKNTGKGAFRNHNYYSNNYRAGIFDT